MCIVIYSVVSLFLKVTILTSGGIHCATIADDQAIPRAALTELEEGVFYLQHRAQEILLKFESCNIREKKNMITINSGLTRICYLKGRTRVLI